MSSEIYFERIHVEVDAHYQPKLTLNTDAGSIIGRLDEKPFARGGMKVVYNLQIDKTEYVAKRYAKFDEDQSSDSNIDLAKVKKNFKLISLDAGRLAQCQAFLVQFMEYAAQQEVHRIYHDITVSECFLLKETGFTPSKASGIKLPEDSIAVEEGITWLVEPRRSPAFVKFTGTLSHARAPGMGLAAETVHTFAHFVYELTERQLVLADLQVYTGTWTSVNGKNTLVLFDPMTHTTQGQAESSGAGDYGEDGINTFVKDHKCGPVCVAMGLTPGGHVDGSDSEDESEENDLPKNRQARRAWDP